MIARNPVGDALYAWALENFEPGYVFTQQELIETDFIPNQDVQILLSAVDYLCRKAFFRLHDKSGGGIGWELVDPETAKNYTGLTPVEQIVLQTIHGAKNSGIWTRHIQNKTNIHQTSIEKAYKALEAKGLIKSMKSVANPQRKMYITAGLTPSEDTTGGSWFSEGALDQGLVSAIANTIELHVSHQSWQEDIPESLDDSTAGHKRKRPSDGFEEIENDRVKLVKTIDGTNKAKSAKASATHKTYKPFEPGYKSYPTVRDVTRFLADSKITASALPQNAIAQLLQIMVWDDRLFTVSRPVQANEKPDDPTSGTVTMYRCLKSPLDFQEQRSLLKRKVHNNQDVRVAAYRQEELESLGPGGTSEVPCIKCPVADICTDGGLVNANTCQYLYDWYENLELADQETEFKAEKVNSKGKDKSLLEKGKGKETGLTKINGERGPRIEIEMDMEELEPS